MKRVVRLVISCFLGLLVPAFIFPWLVRALVPAKKTTPPVTFTPAADTTQKATFKTTPLGHNIKPDAP